MLCDSPTSATDSLSQQSLLLPIQLPSSTAGGRDAGCDCDRGRCPCRQQQINFPNLQANTHQVGCMPALMAVSSWGNDRCWLNPCRSGRRSLKITWAFITKSYLRSAAAARFLFFSEELPDADLQRYSASLQTVHSCQNTAIAATILMDTCWQCCSQFPECVTVYVVLSSQHSC